jgi:hypothetical protein
MSKYFTVSPVEIEEHWSIDDVDYAHEALNYVEYLERQQAKEFRRR